MAASTKAGRLEDCSIEPINKNEAGGRRKM
jgi:hypothetical protein